MALPGPAQQDFDWGGLNVSQPFFLGGGGNLGFSYSQISEGGSKINKQGIDTNIQRLSSYYLIKLLFFPFIVKKWGGGGGGLKPPQPLPLRGPWLHGC